MSAERWDKLLEGVELRDLHVTNMNGNRVKDDETRADSDAGDPALGGPEILASIDSRDGVIEVSCAIASDMSEANFFVAVEAVFTHPDASVLDKDMERMFLNNVGFIVMYPLLRTTLMDLALRLGVDAPPLPLHKAGAFEDRI